jgi:hypothetical protein
MINGRNSANLELLIDKTSSIYLNVKLKALASRIFLSFTSFWRNSDSYEYKNKSAYILQSWKLKRPPIQLRPHHFWTYTSNLTTVVNSVLKFMISGTTSIYLYVKLKALASWFFLSFTSFWRNSDSYEYKNKSAMQQYTSFSCIWCLHLAIDSIWKG